MRAFEYLLVNNIHEAIKDLFSCMIDLVRFQWEIFVQFSLFFVYINLMMIQSDRCKSLKLSKNMLPNRRLPNGNHHHHTHTHTSSTKAHVRPTLLFILKVPYAFYSLEVWPACLIFVFPCINSCDVTVELMLWLLSWLSFCECCGCYVHELIFCVFHFFF
jgi:hypothetical protein